MRHLSFGFVFLVLFVGCAWSGAEEKPYPTHKQVELTGVVREGFGFDANRKREEYYFLHLDKAISVDADQFSDERKGVRDVQLVPLSDVAIGSFLGKGIAIKGKLFHSFSAHHHKKVLLEVGKANNARPVSKP
jgi:hypothetical protein